MGAEGMGGRTAPERGLRPRAPRAWNVVDRSRPRAGCLPRAEDSRRAQAGVSRRSASGFGAQGTEGRVFPPETAAAGRGKGPRRLARVEFAEGLELSSPDDEFKLTFHNLTQAEYRGFPTSQQGSSSPSSSSLASAGTSPGG